MIYLGPLSGRGGSWTSIDVPAYGRDVTGHVRACPRSRRGCHVLDTIPHSTMGDLVVGNYDLNPTVRGDLVSGNAFIYNITRRQWTLLRMHGSLSTKSTFYGIWQDGGPRSPRYTLVGGSSARGGQRGFLINYNERTGAFGRPAFYTYNNKPSIFTHFEGITAVRGGFNLVGMSAGPFPIAGVHPGARQVLRPGALGSGQRRRERACARAAPSPGTRPGATTSWGCTSRRVPRRRTPTSPPSPRGRRQPGAAAGNRNPGPARQSPGACPSFSCGGGRKSGG